jgi:hypothetical protein
LSARLTTLLCKKNTVANSKEVKTGWFNSRRNKQVWQNLLRKAVAQMGCFAYDDDGNDDQMFKECPVP